MTTSPELVIFLGIAFIAVIAAVMMLISENAVHSALFLILNFACVAFLYLMLDAAFLAMVQVTVYAGAIMVLFMFVIMLLGAERLAPEENPRFPWINRVGVGLTALFLLTAGIGILQSDISATAPVAHAPMVRVINAAPELENIAVLLNGETLADDILFYEESDFVEWAAGEYEIQVVVDESEPITLSSVAVAPAQVEVEGEAGETAEHAAPTPELSNHLMLEAGEFLTVIITPAAGGNYGFIPVVEDMASFNNDKFTRVRFVHAMLGGAAIEVADVTEPEDAPRVVVDSLTFGEVSENIEQRADNYQYSIYEVGQVAAAGTEDVSVRDVESILPGEAAELKRDTSHLYLLAAPLNAGATGQVPVLLVFDTDSLPSFGGPVSVGQKLFTTYMLPFQVIALLLLVAMIGAIVMTRDQIPTPKPRFQRRLANVSNKPVVHESSQD